MKQKNKSMFLIVLLALCLPLTVFGAKKSDEMKNTLFSEVKSLIETAKVQKADLLSPDNFNEGHKAYMQASRDFDSGNNLDSIKKNIERSKSYINKAIKNLELSNVTLKNLLQARSEALAAEATTYALKDFSKAEELFKESASYVEKGDVSKARKIAEKAQPQYKKAEMLAIKEGLLGDVKGLQIKAKKDDCEDYVPDMTKLAEKRFKEAEKILDSKNTDMDKAKSKVNEAKFLYEHALALTPMIKTAKKKKWSHEEIYTNFEENLAQISSQLGLPNNYDKGIDHQLKSIAGTIDTMQKDRQNLTARLSSVISENEEKTNQLNARLLSVEKENATLKGKTTAEAERIALLHQKLEKENMLKEKYNRVRNIFDPKEGLVLKDGNDIVLQLHGLTFPSGKSIIDVENFDLLAKVQKAIREYPNANVMIEGHTDSVGDKSYNQILSEERAKAVEKYFVANNTIPEEKLSAVGFGDEKPVAPNKTKDGRAKNRRIDIIIKADQ